MGGDSDFCMNQPADGKTVVGICHARGENASLPPRRGGKVICLRREMGGGKMAVIRDPAGAVAALFEPGKS